MDLIVARHENLRSHFTGKGANRSKNKRKLLTAEQILVENRPEKNQSNVRMSENESPRLSSIDESNDCVIDSELGALVRGSDPPSGQC